MPTFYYNTQELIKSKDIGLWISTGAAEFIIEPARGFDTDEVLQNSYFINVKTNTEPKVLLCEDMPSYTSCCQYIESLVNS